MVAARSCVAVWMCVHECDVTHNEVGKEGWALAVVYVYKATAKLTPLQPKQSLGKHGYGRAQVCLLNHTCKARYRGTPQKHTHGALPFAHMASQIIEA